MVEYLGNHPDQLPVFQFVRRDAWEEDPPEWMLERGYARESVREDFLKRLDDRYTVVMPQREGQWWVVWKRKDAL